MPKKTPQDNRLHQVLKKLPPPQGEGDFDIEEKITRDWQEEARLSKLEIVIELSQKQKNKKNWRNLLSAGARQFGFIAYFNNAPEFSEEDRNDLIIGKSSKVIKMPFLERSLLALSIVLVISSVGIVWYFPGQAKIITGIPNRFLSVSVHQVSQTLGITGCSLRRIEEVKVVSSIDKQSLSDYIIKHKDELALKKLHFDTVLINASEVEIAVAGVESEYPEEEPCFFQRIGDFIRESF